MTDRVHLIQKGERIFALELIRFVERDLNYFNDCDNRVGCLWVRIKEKVKKPNNCCLCLGWAFTLLGKKLAG